MVQEKDLENLNWKDVSILRNPDNSILIVLLFDSQKSADMAAIDIIGKNPFNLNISRTATGTHDFDLVFTESEFGIRYESKYTHDNYHPTTWLTEDVPVFLTTGHKTSDGKITRLAVVLPIDNLNVN